MVLVLGESQPGFPRQSNLHKVVQITAEIVLISGPAPRALLLYSQDDIVGVDVVLVGVDVDCTDEGDEGSALVCTGVSRGEGSGYQVNIPETCLKYEKYFNSIIESIGFYSQLEIPSKI